MGHNVEKYPSCSLLGLRPGWLRALKGKAKDALTLLKKQHTHANHDRNYNTE